MAADATLAQLGAACLESDAPALLVSPGSPEPSARLVTRGTLGAVLLDWYASQLPA